MSLYLYNTLSGKKEKFKPIRVGEVRMYNCGPTVYNYAHIGNLRAYVFTDILRRTLEFNDYKVTQVMNITDVGHLASDADEGEDKMVKALKREGKPMTLEGMREVAKMFAIAFEQDLRILNIKQPNIMPRASEHIAEDIELIKILEEKGFAYRAKNGLYFDTSKFPKYGNLGKINLEGMKAGTRVAENSEKKNQIDFTLWKFSQPGLPSFPSPFGPGFPGWHIECSAMSRKYLGQPFDIHTGGIDHIPTHHQNEIAQSESAYGVPLANYWLHNEHLIVRKGKMAKSGENFITLRTLIEKNISPFSYRYFLLQTHYRSPINFSWEALDSATQGLNRILENLSLLSPIPEKADSNYLRQFMEFINNDLDIPQALSLFIQIARKADTKLSDGVRMATLIKMDEVLGLDIQNSLKKMTDVPEEIKSKGQKRNRAKSDGNFTEADRIRVEIENAGYRIVDIDGTSTIFKKI